MIKGILGKKIGMTRIFQGDGKSAPVSVLEVGPCFVTQIKKAEKDGYNSIQVGFISKKDKHTTNPLKGHFKVAGKGNFRYLCELKVDDIDSIELGQEINSGIFNIGEKVNVSGLSKGRGFAGVVKRWGFSGGDNTHGCRSHRVPGSIGASATPSRVMKGKKLPGRMGEQKVLIKNLEVVDVINESNLILVKGAVPGNKGGLIKVSRKD